MFQVPQDGYVTYVGPFQPVADGFRAHVFDCNGTSWKKSTISIFPVHNLHTNGIGWRAKVRVTAYCGDLEDRDIGTTEYVDVAGMFDETFDAIAAALKHCRVAS
jgi:hypothetical protein